MQRITLTYLCLFGLLLFTERTKAQMVISTPTLGFSQACASPSFNTYNLTFVFSSSTGVEASNQFSIELSDVDGSFSNGTTIYTSAQGEITSSPATVSFSFPTDVAGENYKLRIKSTAPAATSTGSISFPAYYKVQDTPFTINNLIGNAIYCSGGSYLLTIDNPGGPDNDSPLQYPSLTFNWYKEVTETTSTFVSEGESLLVSQSGTYFVETNYGTCTSNSFSNRVTVSEAGSGAEVGINSSNGNPYCSTDGPTTLSTINAESYQWFKDGAEIAGATDQMYITDESGVFSVNINLGSCSTNASIDLDNSGFESTIDVQENNVLNEGETMMVTVTTDANSPEFEWYLNGSLISGETLNTYEVTQIGSYRAVVNQTVGCIASDEFIFNVTEPFPDVEQIPNIVSPNGDGINDTWVIPQAYVEGTNTEIKILNTQGKVVFETTNYLNNWPESPPTIKDINPIYYYIITTQNNETKKGSITLIN
ncbi:gliding motility-associated C-terminal domain-containing protein [Winogradskyella sp. A3E31]|uniref:T9SS type B sorting domain-containing protein n=1 Tax=Winogradskyella sp. A3E31 TaxID=3349637 RepID=UPI00398A6844